MRCLRGEEKKKEKECKQFEILHSKVCKNKVHNNLSVKRRCGDGNDEYKDCKENFWQSARQ